MDVNPQLGRVRLAESTRNRHRESAVQRLALSGASAVATNETCARICDALTRSIGAAGARALLSRALTSSQPGHTALKEIRVGSESSPTLDGLNAAVIAHGEVAVVTGLETLLGSLLTLLGRLIGEDMVTRLMAQIAPRGVPSEEDSND